MSGKCDSVGSGLVGWGLNSTLVALSMSQLAPRGEFSGGQ